MLEVQRRLQKIMRKARVDGILFWSLENIRYLCGFSGSDGALIAADGGMTFLSDSRYETQAQQEIRDAAFQKYRQKGEGCAQIIRTLGVKRLGFEAAAIDFASYQQLREKLSGIDFVPLTEEIRTLRVRKSMEEIATIKEAIRIASDGFLNALPRFRPGVRERSAAEALECRMKKRGAEKTAFDTIVASGPRAAQPHGAPSAKRMENGEGVVIDFGARFQGYHSDETKTLFLGPPGVKQRKIYEIVYKAQEKALRAIRPGVSVRSIDRAARDVITRAGYGEYFGHGLGHGVGLAVHEEPRISPLGRGRVEEGMVFTVEPGIYLPHWGGVRLEDMVRVSGSGYEKLTSLPKELRKNILHP